MLIIVLLILFLILICLDIFLKNNNNENNSNEGIYPEVTNRISLIRFLSIHCRKYFNKLGLD